MRIRHLLAPILLLGYTLYAAELAGERQAAGAVCPTPEEAQKKMTVPPGYAVKCFAHEPMVKNPVGMTWDSRGRLWVVELYEYPEGTPLPVEKRPFGGEATDGAYHPVPAKCKSMDNPLEHEHDTHPNIPSDRVIILEDTDNDGVADKRTVFVEGLNLASAVLCGDGGVYVGQQPHLLHFKDTDGDDHADEWRVVLTGFGREDTHELVNSLSWGPDGWMYMTHGVFTNSKVRNPGEPESKGFKFDAGIGRCRPAGGPEGRWEFEVFADGTSNPWGADYDAKGNYFVSACVIDHLFHMAPGGLYQRQGGAPENPYAYELLPSIVKHKHFRAAYAGIQIYQGGVYPADTHGHVFIGNIHDNAIHEEVLTPVGATFKSEPVRDFLRANDGWFRPVSTQTGPDGNLWVMDWCDKYPCYQNAKANPEGVDRARGRIWRIVHENGARTLLSATSEASPKTADKSVRAPVSLSELKDLSKLATPELVKLLEHPNNWMRRMARRMLVERVNFTEPELVALNELAFKTNNLDAFWTLESMRRNLDILRAAESKDEGLRMAFARAVGESPNETIFDALGTLADDPSPNVRSSVATALRQSLTGTLTINRRPATQASEGEFKILAALSLASKSSPDATLPFQIWMALEPMIVAKPAESLDQLAAFAPNSQPLSQTLTYKSMRRLCDTRDAKNIDFAIAFCDKIKAHDVLLAHALEGLVKGQDNGVIKPTSDVSKPLAAWRTSANADVRKQGQQLAVLWGDQVAIAEAMTVALDAKAPLQERINALKSARKSGAETFREGLTKLLRAETPEPLLLEVIRASAEAGGNEWPLLLVQSWPKATPIARTAMAEALITKPEPASVFLDAIADNRIARADVPMTVSRHFAQQKDAALKKRATEVLGVWRESNADVKALIAAKRKACLEGEPDLALGKMLFATSCATCHTFHGGGQKVGPELIGSGRSNLDAILANVIDPNQIIGNGYEAINVLTKDDRTISGRMVEDAPGHVKLLAIGGAEQIVPRDQIAKLENTHQSMMPMGFGALPDDAFRSLIWYVLSPPEEGPLTKEKKAALSTNMDAVTAAAKPKNNSRAIDWESVSLWNPEWKVSAPDFERTPLKLSEFHGRKNVLLMHPFDEKKPSSLERTMKLEAGKPHQLTVNVAAHDQGDWELRVAVDGEVIKKAEVNHDGERWKTVTVDLSAYAGKEVKLRLEGAATGWSWEFGYWGEIKVE
ncbi:MAG: hypothetical protein RL693_1707 [Verrucomicrobiota bacterium]